MESIESASSFKSLPSPNQFATGHSSCSFRGPANSAASSRSLEETPREARRSGGGVFSELQGWFTSQELSKPWQRLGGGEGRRAAWSHALLYLALTDPVLSATALVSTKTAKRHCANPSKKEGLEHEDSSLVSLSALLGFACIVLLFAFASGVAVGSALVRSRPSLGSAIIAVIPDGVHVDKSGWESDADLSAYPMDSLVLPAGMTKGEDYAIGEDTAALDAKPRVGRQLAQNVKGAPPEEGSAFVLMLPQNRGDPGQPLALLKGAFTLYLPQHNHSLIGGTHSGVFFLEYIAAPRAGRMSRDLCFLPHADSLDSKPLSQLTDKYVADSSLREDQKSESVLSRTHDEELGFDKGEQTPRIDAAIPFATKPLPGVSAAATASAKLTAVEPSGTLLKAARRYEHASGSSIVEMRLKDANETIKELELYPELEGSQRLLNLGTYLPLHGDTILSEDFEGDLTNDVEAKTQKENAQQSATEVSPSSADERPLTLHSLLATPSARIRHLLELSGGKNARRLGKTKPGSDAPATLTTNMPEELDSQELFTSVPHSRKHVPNHFNGSSNKAAPSSAATDDRRGTRRKTENNKPRLLAASFQPMIDAQANGFQAFEVEVTLSHKVYSRDMYENLLRDCQLGRVYVQLSTALAYYTLFYWEDAEYHKYLPFPLGCVVQNWPSTTDSLEGLSAAH
ncbi:hypothetical protein Emed_000380 [Eimeria media]